MMMMAQQGANIIIFSDPPNAHHEARSLQAAAEISYQQLHPPLIITMPQTLCLWHQLRLGPIEFASAHHMTNTPRHKMSCCTWGKQGVVLEGIVGLNASYCLASSCVFVCVGYVALVEEGGATSTSGDWDLCHHPSLITAWHHHP
jgi:hypothetical protein